jgi:hypothetical protein
VQTREAFLMARLPLTLLVKTITMIARACLRLRWLEAGGHTLFLFCLDVFQQQFHPLDHEALKQPF